MTKYLLHGGATSTNSESNKKFFKEATKDIPEDGNILLVYFAKDESRWKNLEKEDKKNFDPEENNKFKFIIAEKNTEILEQQIKDADLTYIRGGDSRPLKELLGEVKNLKKLFEGKIVAASSAGVYVLSKYFFSYERKGIHEGLGILPIKNVCHYDKETFDISKLENYKEDLKVYKIPEGEYIKL